MKHYSGIDYSHFLDDIRDMYPFSIDEAVLVELVANSLDAKTGLIDIRVDPEQSTFELTDTGNGMDAKGFEAYHNFSTSFKRKGDGIGFAGLGAKLALKVADRIVSETRSKNFWGASEWKFQRKGKTAHPVWYDLAERTLVHSGTCVKVYLKSKAHSLLKPEEVRRIMLAHYLPLLTLSDFYESLRLYRRVTILINGEVIAPPATAPEKFKQLMLYSGKSRRPFGLARFECFSSTLPENQQGIAISTFGKVIRRDYLRQYFKEMGRVTGTIEVPELVECLTTSKCDFRKEGSAGRRYYRFSKIAQREFRRWLEELQIVDQTDVVVDKDVKRLERVVTRIVSGIPDLQHFYGFRSERPTLVQDPGGETYGAVPQALPHSENEDAESPEHSPPTPEDLIKTAMEEVRGGRALEPGEDIAATRRLRSTKFGPTLRYVDAVDRADISWMEGDMVLINTAHPTYRKAVEKKVVEYHNLFATAIAMLREVPTGQEKIELLEKFMVEWGRL